MTTDLHIRDIKARAVMAPMRRGLATSIGEVKQAPLVLIDIAMEEGITGISYLFSPNPIALRPLVALFVEILPLIKGLPAAPRAIEKRLLRGFRLLGGTGLATMAVAGIDMALWDAAGKAAGLPLARLWGGEVRPVRAYNSNGLGLMGPERTAAEAIELLEFGFDAIKLRLGYPTLEADLAAARAVRKAVGELIVVMADYNQCLDVAEAIRRGRALDGEGLAWIEEPVSADDYAGSAAVADALATPVQIGENFWSTQEMQKALAVRSSDFVMPDAMKIGGATAWLRAAALAEAARLPISSHLFPEVSGHLLAAAPTAHYLEYVDWADPVLVEPLEIRNGSAILTKRPGNGMVWNEAAIARLLV